MYLEIARGDTSKRNIIINEADYIKEISKCEGEHYRSYFYYDQSINEYVNDHGTASKFTGTYSIKEIIFDIDKGKRSDQETLTRAKVFYNRLMDEWELNEDQIRVWFSGTGYHIEIPDIFGFESSNYLPIQVKNTLVKYFPESDDLFYTTSLIRSPFTLNIKSKLYKTLLIDFNRVTVEEVKRLSQKKNVVDLAELKATKLHKERIVAEVRNKLKLKASDPTKNFTCVQKIFNEGPVEGTRHNRMMRMISTFRRQGIPKEGILSMMEKYVDGGMKSSELVHHVESIYDSEIEYGCKDVIMKEFCDSRCRLFNKVYGDELPIFTASDMEKESRTFWQSDLSKSSLDLKPIWKLKKPFKVYPQELCVLIGETGIGKTAFIQNMIINLPKIKTLFFELEISNRLLHRRNVQIKYGMTKDEVNEHFRNSDKPLSNGLEHINVVHHAPDLPTLKRTIQSVKPQLVIIDTVENIIVEGKDGVGKLDAIVRELMKIKNECNTIILAVHHISKHALTDPQGKPKHLDIHSGKGSSTLEQQADLLIGIEGSPETLTRTVYSLKSRDEDPFTALFNYKADTNFRYVPIDV